jgi:hypothetical protein
MQNSPMPRLISLSLVLILTTMIHVDWHFARPHHHRLSLEWSSHWLFGMVFFAVAGWYVARRWSDRPWRAAAWNVALALIIAQGIEPVLEAAYSGQRLGYSVGSERWLAFWQCVGAGLPTFVLALWATRRKSIAARAA